jgi:hypothetical protein
MAHEKSSRRPRRRGGRRWTAARPSAGAGRTRAPTYARSPQRGSDRTPCTTVRWNSWRAIDVLRAHRAAARRTSVGELDRHGAAGAAAEATLARAAATRDDLLAQILGWADPADTGDAMARHAGRSAEG